MYAIVEDSGTQIRMREGDVLLVDLREVPENAKDVVFDRVVMVSAESGGDRSIGKPYVNGASVKAEIVDREIKGDKIDVIKFKRRKGYRRKQGHRQRYMKVRVASIAS